MSKEPSGPYKTPNPNSGRLGQGAQKTASTSSAPSDTKESRPAPPVPPAPSVSNSVWGKAPLEAIRAAPPTPSLATAVPSSSSRLVAAQASTNQSAPKTKLQLQEKDKTNQQPKDKRHDHHRHHDQQRSNQRPVAGNSANVESHDRKKVQQTKDHRSQNSKDSPHHNQKHGHAPSKHHHRNHHTDEHRPPQNQNVENKNEADWERGKTVSDELFMPGDGETHVRRIRVEDLLAMRLAMLDLPPMTSIPNVCIWDSPTRKDELTLIHSTPRHLGDVSALSLKKKTKKEPETAPMIEDCKPLEINQETRWKAKVFEGNAEKVISQEHREDETDDAVLKKALLILNKLSLTKFDKLSDDFLACGIGRNEKCLRGATQLIVKKAQDEQHFSAMYAALCLKLAATPMALDGDDDAKKGKKFKKMLLEECQKEFEEDTVTKIDIATKEIRDEDEKRIVADLVKKHYLGHMRFIGELYKGDIISIKIMLVCLPALLESDRVIGHEDIKSEIDEEKIECFTKLMATIGYSLEQQSEAMRSIGKNDASEKLQECWDRVAVLADKTPGQCPNVGTRIKFLLQDLIELKHSGWIARRKEESAKTLAEIHMEAEEGVKASHPSLNRSVSDVLKRQSSYASFERPKPVIDADGFTEIPKAKFGRSRSMYNFSTSSAPSSTTARRSETAVSEHLVIESGMDDKIDTEKKSPSDQDVEMVTQAQSTIHEMSAETSFSHKPVHEFIIKAKATFKEFFRSGDLDDAMLSFQELLTGVENPDARCAKMIETSIMSVLEMKNEDVTKLLRFISRCFDEKKLVSSTLLTALGHPLDVLQDISIDAPHAGRHLVTIVAELIKLGYLSFDFLLETPEFFRLEGGAARFGCDVFRRLGKGQMDLNACIQVIEKLMTDEDRQSYTSAAEMVSTLQK